MNRIPPLWMIGSLRKSHLMLGMLISRVTQTQAQELRDGAEGWSILEIVCHVRDYQEIFFDRIRLMVEEDLPVLKAYDEVARHALVADRQYDQQNLSFVYDDYCKMREKLISYLTELKPDQWQRVGIHPTIGEDDVSVEVFHTISHDLDHAEQIGRILKL